MAAGGRGRRQTGGGFRDIFSQFFSGHGEEEASRAPEKGTDLEYGLNIDFWQAINGTQVELNITPAGSLRHLPRHRLGRRRRPSPVRSATAPAR